MHLRHAAALALIGWYLMRPRCHTSTLTPPTQTLQHPYRDKVVITIFLAQKECEAYRANPWDQCIASDAPRLKEKIARRSSAGCTQPHHPSRHNISSVMGLARTSSLQTAGVRAMPSQVTRVQRR